MGFLMDRNVLYGSPPVGARTAVVVAVLVVIALVHGFRVGSYLSGTLYTLYYSYFSDVIVPFGMYFLLCLNEVSLRFLRDWRVKAALVFTVASLTELAQAIGIPLLGLTFDPLDLVMFGAGTLLAVLADRVLLARTLPSWTLEESAELDSTGQ